MKLRIALLLIMVMVLTGIAFAADSIPVDANGRFVLIDQDDILVYLTGKYEDSYSYLNLETVVVNNSDQPITISIEDASINGWDVYGTGVYDTNPGKKQKDNISFSMDDAEIEKLSEITDLDFSIIVYESSNYNTLFTTDKITIFSSEGAVEAPAAKQENTAAEPMDITAMTDDELTALYEAAQEEMLTRGLIEESVESNAEVTSTEDISAEEISEEVPDEVTSSDAEPAEDAAPAEEASETANAFTALKKGDKNDDVKAVQKRLIDLGYLSGKADGDFGGKSEKAVIAFQKAAKINVTGVVDEETYNAMMANDAPVQIVYEKLPYDAISRDPDTYKGKHYTFTGKVLQVMESGNSVELRVATRKGWDDVVYVNYTRSEGESRILEDDKITVNGEYAGLMSYTTVMGATVTIPEINADTIG